MIKRLLVLPILVLGMTLSPGIALASSGIETADAKLEPNTSFGPSVVNAEIHFIDDTVNNRLTIHGSATGLVPGAAYFSLVYDVTSLDEGRTACLPGVGPGDPRFLDQPQMVVGFWVNNGDGTGTLDAVKSPSGNTNAGLAGSPFATAPAYVPISKIGTMSVRIVLGPPPGGFVLRACGSL